MPNSINLWQLMSNKFFLLILILIFATTSEAQQLNCRTATGLISGSLIESDNGLALAGPTIILSRIDDSLGLQSTVTGASGQFIFEELVCGFYRVSMKALGIRHSELTAFF